MQQWHRFKETDREADAAVAQCVESDALSRLVVQGSAQLCIPHASPLPLFHLWRRVCVCVYRNVCRCAHVTVSVCISLYGGHACSYRGLVWAACPLHA